MKWVDWEGWILMDHLPGFWDDGNWSNKKWTVYKKRLKKRGIFRESLDQFLHQIMGRVLSRKTWEKRETKQWPSKTGSYDACADHYNWLLGRGENDEAENLRRLAQERRKEFL